MSFSKTSWTIGILLSLHASPLLAVEADPKPYPACDLEANDTVAAKGAFQAGSAAFNEADYDRAITYWEDAYRRDCQAHALLKNLARAYELNGMFKHAIEALRTYQERSPNPAEQDSIDRRIANLKLKLKEQSRPPPVEAKPRPPVTVAARPQQPSPPSAEQPIPSEELAADSDGSRPVWPLYMAGAGAAVAIGGFIPFLIAKGDEADAEDACGGREDCPQSIVDQGNDAIDRVNLFGAVSLAGVGIAATGAVLYFLQPEEEEEAMSWSPVVAPGFAGVRYGTTF